MRLRRFTIALNLPLSVPKLIVFGRHVVQKMTNNTWFPSPSPVLSVVSAHIDQLEASQAKTKDRTKGTAATRDVDRLTVEEDLKALKAYVGIVVHQNPGQEAVIIESSGFAEKRFTRTSKQDLAAVLGPIQGQILVKAKAVGKGAGYEWQVSTDGGTTWVTFSTTPVANTSFAGAVANSTYLFRFRSTRKGVTSEWSASVRIAVH